MSAIENRQGTWFSRLLNSSDQKTLANTRANTSFADKINGSIDKAWKDITGFSNNFDGDADEARISISKQIAKAASGQVRKVGESINENANKANKRWSNFWSSVKYHGTKSKSSVDFINEAAKEPLEYITSQQLAKNLNGAASTLSYKAQTSDLGVLLEDLAQSDTSDIQKRRGWGWLKYLPERETVNRGIKVAQVSPGRFTQGVGYTADFFMKPVNLVLGSTENIANESERTREAKMALLDSKSIDALTMQSVSEAGVSILMGKGLNRAPGLSYSLNAVEASTGYGLQSEVADFVGRKVKEIAD